MEAAGGGARLGVDTANQFTGGGPRVGGESVFADDTGKAAFPRGRRRWRRRGGAAERNGRHILLTVVKDEVGNIVQKGSVDGLREVSALLGCEYHRPYMFALARSIELRAFARDNQFAAHQLKLDVVVTAATDSGIDLVSKSGVNADALGSEIGETAGLGSGGKISGKSGGERNHRQLKRRR
jgi:hypothetical protein